MTKQTPRSGAGVESGSPARWKGWLVGAVFIVLLGVAFWFVRSRSGMLNPVVLRQWLQQAGPLGGALVVVVLAFLLVVPVIPATVVQIGAGLAFGPAWGLLYVMLGDAAGAAIGFILADRWGKRVLERFVSERSTLGVLRLAAGITPLRVMLLRLLPGPAYPLVSLAAGLSSIRWWQYMIASLIGVLPSLALLVLAGDLVTRSPWKAFMLVVIIAVLLALLARIGRRYMGGNER
ncbi:MAG: hypothetical protein NVS4B8_07710 [Herpetosiphon sp.]